MQIQLSLLAIIESTGKSLGEVQLSEIAAGVGSKGISPANVYTYYATKEEILRDAVDARLAERKARMDLNFRRTESFGEYVARMVDSVITLWERNADVLRTAAGLAACGPEYQLWWREQFDPWGEAFRDAVTEARAAGELPEVSGDVGTTASVAAWTMAVSCQVLMTTSGTPEHRETLQETLTLLVRRMLGERC